MDRAKHNIVKWVNELYAESYVRKNHEYASLWVAMIKKSISDVLDFEMIKGGLKTRNQHCDVHVIDYEDALDFLFSDGDWLNLANIAPYLYEIDIKKMRNMIKAYLLIKKERRREIIETKEKEVDNGQLSFRW